MMILRWKSMMIFLSTVIDYYRLLSILLIDNNNRY